MKIGKMVLPNLRTNVCFGVRDGIWVTRIGGEPVDLLTLR